MPVMYPKQRAASSVAMLISCCSRLYPIDIIAAVLNKARSFFPIVFGARDRSNRHDDGKGERERGDKCKRKAFHGIVSNIQSSPLMTSIQ